MANKIEVKKAVKREKGKMYFVDKNGNICSCKRKGKK